MVTAIILILSSVCPFLLHSAVCSHLPKLFQLLLEASDLEISTPSLTHLQPQHKPLPSAFPVSAKGVTTLSPQIQESSSPFLLSPTKSNHSLAPTDSTSLMIFIPFPFVYPVASTLVKACYRCLPSPFQFILDISSSVSTQQTKLPAYCYTPLIKACGNKQRPP